MCRKPEIQAIAPLECVSNVSDVSRFVHELDLLQELAEETEVVANTLSGVEALDAVIYCEGLHFTSAKTKPQPDMNKWKDFKFIHVRLVHFHKSIQLLCLALISTNLAQISHKFQNYVNLQGALYNLRFLLSCILCKVCIVHLLWTMGYPKWSMTF